MRWQPFHDYAAAIGEREARPSAWRRGRLVMSLVPLAAVIAEINRYRRVPLDLIGTSLAKHPVNIAINLARGRFLAPGPDALPVPEGDLNRFLPRAA